jgi:GNAT superfamily N-acetyltransferase
VTARHTRDEFVLTDDPQLLDLSLIHEWLSTRAYWALGRPEHVVRESFANSRSYGIYGGQSQVGVARIVTDSATFAWICDVFIDESVRGRGLGHWLMERIVDDLETEGIPRLILGTRDAHGVYADVGFTPLAYPERWMEIDKRANRHTLATQEV